MGGDLIKDRLKRLQRHYDLVPDGVLGPVTLTALERAAGLEPPWSLRVSRKSIDMIVRIEIISAAYYRKNLMYPIWPGGASGVTIGIGYDLGYRTWGQIEKDWGPFVDSTDLRSLGLCEGRRGEEAEDWLGRGRVTNLSRIEIPLEAARDVFYRRTLPDYAKKTRKAFPGVELLPGDAQGALLSLVYNRGTAMSGARRREMAAIRRVLESSATGTKHQLLMIAGQLRDMKRLWIGKNLDGLLRRREKEAQLVEGSDREYGPGELVSL